MLLKGDEQITNKINNNDIMFRLKFNFKFLQ